MCPKKEVRDNIEKEVAKRIKSTVKELDQHFHQFRSINHQGGDSVRLANA